jgi:hypothetical protein
METNYLVDGNTIFPYVNKPILETFFKHGIKIKICQKKMFKQMRSKQI